MPRIHGLVKKRKPHGVKKRKFSRGDATKQGLSLAVVFGPLCTVLAALIASLGVFAGLGLTANKQTTDNTNALNEQYTTALAGLTSGDATVRAGAISNLEIIADNWSTWPDLQKSDREIQIKAIINTLIVYLHRPIPQDSDGVYDEAEKYIRDSIAGIFQRHLVPASSNDDQPEPSDTPTPVPSETASSRTLDVGNDSACLISVPGTYFIGSWSKYPLDFSHTYWNNVNFKSAVFDAALSFDNADFLGDVDFSEAVFANDAAFVLATFHGEADFSEATFASNATVDFRKATFLGNAAFISTVFNGEAIYDEALFSGAAVWNETVFLALVGYDGVAFSGDSVFIDNSHFCRNVYFEDAQFGLPSTETNSFGVSFQSNYFSGNADFSGAAFYAADDWFPILFTDTIFLGQANFDYVSFAGDGVDFESVSFLTNASFSNAAVSGSLNNPQGNFSTATNCGLEFNHSQFAASVIVDGLSVVQGCLSLADVTGLQGTVTLSEGTQITMPDGTTHLASEGSTVNFP